jgi:hypothetical protein
MPDIKTALTSALQEKQMQTTTQAPTPEVLETVREWAADDMRARIPREPKYTGYLSRDIFLYVQANPGKTYKEVEEVMATLPYKYNITSCGTLLSQMRRVGMVARDESSRYTTIVPQYVPIYKPEEHAKKYKMKKRPKASVAKAEVRGKISREPVAAQKPAPTPVVAPPPTVKAADLDKLLSELSFPQAIELYKKLRAMLSTATNIPLI